MNRQNQFCKFFSYCEDLCKKYVNTVIDYYHDMTKTTPTLLKNFESSHQFYRNNVVRKELGCVYNPDSKM